MTNLHLIAWVHQRGTENTSTVSSKFMKLSICCRTFKLMSGISHIEIHAAKGSKSGQQNQESHRRKFLQRSVKILTDCPTYLASLPETSFYKTSFSWSENNFYSRNLVILITYGFRDKYSTAICTCSLFIQNLCKQQSQQVVLHQPRGLQPTGIKSALSARRKEVRSSNPLPSH